jgi:hypothetical protein
MSCHHWSDETFDWKALDNAMSFIYKYSQIAKLNVMMKEKYGTIRYEFYPFWGFRKTKWIARLQLYWFESIVLLSTLKYRHIAEEILNDTPRLADMTPKIPWYAKHILKNNPWSKC